LGENFPGMKVAFSAKDETASTKRWDLRRYFYFAALLLVLSVTSFGAYLVWRDVRRELNLTALRSQFVSSVSHELKTPLTAIRMFAETLRMRRASDQQTQAEYLDTIVNESERLTRLLNNVLDFSKIEQGKKTYHLAPTSLSEVVQTSARILEYPLAQQGFELHVNVENNLPSLNADRDALQQAILNLLTNAMKYSGESREIDLRLATQNGDAVIEVTDRGVGIASEEQRRIFEKFYRVPTPENKLISGTGLGLTLVEHVAKGHGGRVEVRSVIAGGSTFALHLPLENEL
jgi:signal transduction histidine kinase